MTIRLPAKIAVGFRERKDTVDGRLSFPTYIDERGNMGKKVSVDNWRDPNINIAEFDNVPTAGVMLNFGSKGYSYGWDSRNAFIRCYDPRGFEFEIDAENLVYIIKNSGYDVANGFGELVYGWDKGKLLLVSINAPDYRAVEKTSEVAYSLAFIKAGELIPGNVYARARSGNRSVYLGRLDAWKEFNHASLEEQEYRGKLHIFYNVDTYGSFVGMKSISGAFVKDEGPANFKELKIYEYSHRYTDPPVLITSLEGLVNMWNSSSEASPVDRDKDEIIPFLPENLMDQYYDRLAYIDGKPYSVDSDNNVVFISDLALATAYYLTRYNYKTRMPNFFELKPYRIQTYLANGNKYVMLPTR